MMTEIIDAITNLNGMDQQQVAHALVAQARLVSNWRNRPMVEACLTEHCPVYSDYCSD